MNYKVVSFVPKIANAGNASDSASQLESLISSHSSQDWEFVSVENLSTYQAGSDGCFGVVGKTEGKYITTQLVVFKK